MFELEEDVFELEDDVFELEEDVFELEEDVFELENDVFELEDDVFELEDDVFEPEDDVFELEDDVFELEDDVFELEDDVFELEDDVFEPEDDVFELEDDVFELEDDVGCRTNGRRSVLDVDRRAVRNQPTDFVDLSVVHRNASERPIDELVRRLPLGLRRRTVDADVASNGGLLRELPAGDQPGKAFAVLGVRIVEPQEQMELRRLMHGHVVVPHGRDLVALAVLDAGATRSDGRLIPLHHHIAAIQDQLVRGFPDQNPRGALRHIRRSAHGQTQNEKQNRKRGRRVHSPY